MIRTTTIAALALAALLIPGRAALAAVDEAERATLKGLPGVEVIVESPHEDQRRAGFDERAFQTDVELKLRRDGIKVLSREQRLATPGKPYLYVNINSLHKKPGSMAAYKIDLRLYQLVRLDRKVDVEAICDGNAIIRGYRCIDARAVGTHIAATWSKGVVGYGDLSYTRDHVKDLVDEFINAWLSVNPKE